MGNSESKAYSAPKLVVYGDMVKFTASGTGAQTEGTGGGSQPADKKPA
jgi:hypothetical protein